MVPLQVQIHTGPGTSRRDSFVESPVTFGRGPDNRIVVAEPTASRRHGELRYEDGRWVLANLSPNGTWVNGRRVGRRPRPLADRDAVSVGPHEIFRVILPTGAAGAPLEEAPADAGAPERAPMPRWMKLLIAIGAWWVVLLALAGLLLTLDDAEEEGVQAAPELRDAEIEAVVRRRPEVRSPDPREAQEQLAAARELFGKLDTSPSGLYLAHRAYQLALAHSRKEIFDEGLDNVRFQDLQERLVRAVQERYRLGYEQLRSGQYREAMETFRRLNQELYPEPDSPLYRNVEHQRKAAAAAARRKR